MVVKSRQVAGPSYITERYLDGKLQKRYSVSSTASCQLITTFSNPYRDIGKGRDVGGPFLSQKFEVTAIPDPLWIRYFGWDTFTVLYPNDNAKSACRLASGGSGDSYIQAQLATVCPAFIPASQLDARGATAISRVSPTNPVFDGATALAELFSERKLFSVPGKSGSLSGEYLNYQLGVSPAIGAYSDLRSAMQQSERIVDQLHRDSGKVVRRRYQFPSVSTDTTSSYSDYPRYDEACNAYQISSGTITTSVRTETNISFSGAFTYHVPSGLGFARTVAELDKKYGVKPGIDTVWELIPYSFVVDYFSNAGDVIKNINALSADGLVMVYGYVMANTVKTSVYTWKGAYRVNSGAWVPYTSTVAVKATTMERRGANPFGFGILDSDLSPRQVSILAALGMSRR